MGAGAAVAIPAASTVGEAFVDLREQPATATATAPSIALVRGIRTLPIAATVSRAGYAVIFLRDVYVVQPAVDYHRQLRGFTRHGGVLNGASLA